MLVETRAPHACQDPAESPADVAALRQMVRRIEGADRATAGAVPLGLSAIDDHLPEGGLARAALHELRPGPAVPGPLAAAPADPGEGGADLAADGAVLGLAALLLGRASVSGRGRVLWIGGRDLPYLPGLIGFGLTASALLTVTAPALRERLWAAEEAAASGAFDAVVLTGDPGGLTASRRLQLATERGGTLLLALGSRDPASAASAATTRWSVHPIPSPPPVDALGTVLPGLGDPAWRVDLLRARGARPTGWDVVCRPGGALTLAAPAKATSAPTPASLRPEGAGNAAEPSGSAKPAGRRAA